MPSSKTRGRASPRAAAARALLAIDEGARAEEALAELAPGDGADRAMTWNLVLGVLRTRSALDAGIAQAARRAPWTLDAPVLAVLRVGAYELAHTRAPPHAVVHEAVEASRAVRVGHASGLVNAVLRRVRVPTEGDTALGFPEWLLKRWRSRQPNIDAYLRACNEPAPVHIVARDDGAGVAAAFQHRGLVLVPAADGVFLLPPRAGRIDELPGFAEGRWWVMDPAAVAVADLVPRDAQSVLDTCAAPGGKSFRLAARGHAVTATDSSESRLERLREGAARLSLPLAVSRHDWSQARDGQFDAVLVDAPCTALGLLRRHPEIRWRRDEADIERAAERQRAILANAAACVRPGGALVYAVCSPEPEEGPAVAASLGWREEARFENFGNAEGADVFWACRLRRPQAAG
ncbi:MAG: hypothetical protein FJ102_13345 [Deltaproteobacteria bacterium]|nr:hypothetical protein [Deltaproteobacteria bacterium]